LTSPWRRAQQTAAILAPIAAAPPIETELLCRSPRAELLALIAAQGGPTAAVGHAPWLGELAAWLAFGDTRHAEAIQLKKGGVAHLSGTAIPGGMILRALHPPRALRAAGGA
jgi:phosphohistidine phosphatase